jgi:transposase-like protein
MEISNLLWGDIFMAKPKYSPTFKITVAKAYLTGEGSQRFLAAQYGVSYSTVEDWARKYKEFGEKGFALQSGNASYSAEFKLKCVESYLRGENSLDDIVIKYNISTKRVLQSWIQRYNANKELKDYDPKREVYMADARRKTTLEERKEITEYCITHNKDYKGTAALYDVSYSQVYTWVKKYLTEGEEGLVDKRGHHKTDDEVDELQRLRRENLRLKRQLEEQNMMVELLKKVKEFERM